MAPSPNPSSAGNSPRTRVFDRTRSILFAVILVLLVVCMVSVWATRGTMTYLRGKNGAHRGGAAQTLVNLQPWQTAQALAALAVTAEENEYAREAERLADHEVDQAFAAALRQARLDSRHRTLTGDALALSQKIAQLEQLKQQDQTLVDSLTAKTGNSAPAKNSAENSPDSDDLDVAKAQLGLDSDELADAQRELARASGDHSDEIQDELTAHEESMRKYDSGVQNNNQIAVLSARQRHTLASRIQSWFNQNERKGLLEQALAETQNEVRVLTAEHEALEQKANAAANATDATDRAARLASIKDRSVERQILSIDDDRIQTEQQLAAVYNKWLAQLRLQHQIVLHMILSSISIILAILVAMLLCDAVVRRVMMRPVFDRWQMHTLRSVLVIGIQVLGASLILLVIFGPPKETPTILGLATAALTIALQDYILAFLGWFVLMGRNGIHIGDGVEINGVSGEVVELGLLSTTLLETGGLSDQGYPTGRRISFMNGFAIRGQFFNFSTAGQWMWDSIEVNVPAAADIHSVMDEAQKIVGDETRENAQRAEQEWKHGPRSGRLSHIGTDPVLNLRPSGSGAVLEIRYVTSAARRVELRARLYQQIAELFERQRLPEE